MRTPTTSATATALVIASKSTRIAIVIGRTAAASASVRALAVALQPRQEYMASPLAAPKLTEAELQQQVLDLARALRWKVAHFRPAKTSKGWRTPVAADGAGWPDLCLVRDRVVFAELKTKVGTLTQQQQDWLAWLTWAGAEAYVWRPQDLEEIARVLR